MRYLMPLLMVLALALPVTAKDWEVEVITVEHYDFAEMEASGCHHRYEIYVGVKSVLSDALSPIGDHKRKWVKLTWKD